MVPKIGCDLVYLPKFRQTIERSGKDFLEKVFSESELSGDPSIETLAGWFGVKEATLKALSLKPGCWKEIEVGKRESGRPFCKIRNHELDASISHDGEYVMATVISVPQ